MMPTAPPRYLIAHLGAARPDREALLRFPPGVTFEDVRRDDSLWRWAPLQPVVVRRLRGLGVEVVAMGKRVVSEALRRAAAPLSSVDAFAEDCLDANARLGGGRCVTVGEYAMDTRVGDQLLLRSVLRDRLLNMGGVRIYGDAAFREGELPDVLRLRAESVALREVCDRTPDSMPCRLHGGRCRGYRVDDIGDALYFCVDERHAGARVAVPRRLLDEARDWRDPRRAVRALLDVVGLVFDALPGDAWDWSGGRLSRALASLVAAGGRVVAAGTEWGGCLDLKIPDGARVPIAQVGPFLLPLPVGIGGPAIALVGVFGPPATTSLGGDRLALVWPQGLAAHVSAASHNGGGIVTYLAVIAPGSTSAPQIGHFIASNYPVR